MSGDRAPVESVDRALQLVSILRDEQVLTVTHAAGVLGVAPSTAHRLLAALVYRGYAVQGPDRSYRAGPELGDRQSEAGRLRNLRIVARPALEQLHDTTGETVELMALQGENVCYLDGIESLAPLRVTARIGDLMPAHCASGGKVLLADLSDTELDRLYAQGLPPWPTAQITELDELKRQLRKIRRTGYATNVEESEQGVCALGVAVRDASDRAVAALVVALPSARYERRDVPRYLEVLNDAAAVAGRALPPEAAAGQPQVR